MTENNYINEQLLKQISAEQNVKISQIKEVLKLLNEGATVPFIARYRKEQTDGLDEEQIRAIWQQWDYGQKLAERKEDVMRAIRMIMFWSMVFTMVIVILLNIFLHVFFSMFGQGAEFIEEGTSVIRMVSLGMIIMSMANIWLNSVTGTGHTRVNLMIEIVAISLYMIYTWYFMKVNYVSLAMAWSNEFIYWLSILIMAFWFMKRGKWKEKVQK